MPKYIHPVRVNKKLMKVILDAKNLAGKTAIEIAAECYVTRQTYMAWERGRMIPSVEKCTWLAHSLKIDIKCLLEICHPVVHELLVVAR